MLVGVKVLDGDDADITHTCVLESNSSLVAPCSSISLENPCFSGIVTNYKVSMPMGTPRPSSWRSWGVEWTYMKGPGKISNALNYGVTFVENFPDNTPEVVVFFRGLCGRVAPTHPVIAEKLDQVLSQEETEDFLQRCTRASR